MVWIYSDPWPWCGRFVQFLQWRFYLLRYLYIMPKHNNFVAYLCVKVTAEKELFLALKLTFLL